MNTLKKMSLAATAALALVTPAHAVQVGSTISIRTDGLVSACPDWNDIHKLEALVVTINSAKGQSQFEADLQEEESFLGEHKCKKLAGKSEWKVLEKVPFEYDSDEGYAWLHLADKDSNEYWVWMPDDFTSPLYYNIVGQPDVSDENSVLVEMFLGDARRKSVQAAVAWFLVDTCQSDVPRFLRDGVTRYREDYPRTFAKAWDAFIADKEMIPQSTLCAAAYDGLQRGLNGEK